MVYEKGKVVFRETPTNGVLVSPVTSAAETEKMEETSAPSGPAEPGHAAPSAVTGGRLIRQVFPDMPTGIAGSEVSKDVILEGVVGRDGLVHDMRFVRGDQRLAEAAMEAVRQWRYEPFRSNGAPIDLPSTLEVHFR